MQIAIDKDGKRIFIGNASKIHTYYCPNCGEELILRLGPVRIHHFAHKSNSTCYDAWRYDDKSEWHIKWQNRFPEDCIEVYKELNGEKHRADVLIENKKTVIEFQHSNISTEEFDSRNMFYQSLGYKVIWVFDFVSDYENGYVEFYKGHGFSIRDKRNVFSNIKAYSNNIELFFQFELPVEENKEIARIKNNIDINVDYFDMASFSDDVSEDEDYYNEHVHDSGYLKHIIVSNESPYRLYTDINGKFSIQEFIDYVNGKYESKSSVYDYTGSIFELWTLGNCSNCKLVTFYNTKTDYYFRITKNNNPEISFSKYNGRCYGLVSKDKYSFNPNSSKEIFYADERIWKLIWKT